MKSARKGMMTAWILWILLLAIGCDRSTVSEKTEETSSSPEVAEDAFSFRPGEYEGEGRGNGGMIRVKIEVDEKSILSVVVTENEETPKVGGSALIQIPQKIVSRQSVDVDAVAGATKTSEGIIAGTKQALIKAGATEEMLHRKQEETEIPQEAEKMEADVVVVGAGGAGTAAAVAAAEAGAKVIVLEKTSTPGGATSLGEGFFASDSNSAREMEHPPVNVEEIFELWMKEMQWRVDGALVRRYLEGSGVTADWLEAHGLKFHKADPPTLRSGIPEADGYHKYDDFTATRSQLAAMLKGIEERNAAQILTETAATELISQGGAVIGVRGVRGETPIEIRAKAVVLATGGFGAESKRMQGVLKGKQIRSAGYSADTGDGLTMAETIGTATRDMDVMILELHTSGKEALGSDFPAIQKVLATEALIYLPVLPWVDARGERFCNEDIIYDEQMAAEALLSRGGEGWWIFSKSMLDTLETKGARALGVQTAIAKGAYSELAPLDTGWKNLGAMIAKMQTAGAVVYGKTWRELAEETGMDADTFIRTMETYEADAKNGVDSRFGKNVDHMIPLGEEGFYALHVGVDSLATLGGLRIDENFRVLLDDASNGYTPITGLYAAGSTAAGIYSGHLVRLVPGAAQGWAYTSGRLAGEHAAYESLGKEPDPEK